MSEATVTSFYAYNNKSNTWKIDSEWKDELIYGTDGFELTDNDVVTITVGLSNKKKGKEATVENYSLDDFRKLLLYFRDEAGGNHWLHYLMLVMQSNTARRNSDIIDLKWKDIFDPATGEFREHMEMVEKKTSKYANPLINEPLKKQILLFIQETGVNPKWNEYGEYVFTQYTGTNAGEVMTYNAFYRAIKRACKKLDIQTNAGTHSARKTFGATMYEVHEDDPDRKDMLQEIFNHGDNKTTMRYIGQTKAKKDEYYREFGNVFDELVLNGKQPEHGTTGINAKYNKKKLQSLMIEAFNMGSGLAQASEAEKMQAIAELFTSLEELAH